MTDQNRKKGLEAYYRRKTGLRIAALMSALVTAVLFSVALVRDLEPDRQIFAIGEDLFLYTIYISVGCSVLCLLFCFFFIPKEVRDTDDRMADTPDSYLYHDYYTSDLPAMKICRYACALLLFAEGTVRIYLFFAGKLLSGPAPFITVTMLVLIFPLCLYFVPEITKKTAPGYKKVHLAFGSAGLFWFVMSVMYMYFDRSVSLASPYKLMHQITLIAVLLAITEEIRLHTSLPAVRARLATLCAAFIPCFGFTVGRIAMLISGKSVSADDTVTVFIGLAFSLYLGARMFFYDEY